MLPDHLHSRLERVRSDLEEALEARFVAFIVHGSAARGEHQPGRSGVDVVVVTDSMDAGVLERLRPPLSAGRQRLRIMPFLLAAAELPRVADVFPLKLLDIRRHHVLLHGKCDWSGVAPTIEHQRLRLEQSLRNHLLRLRRAVALWGDDTGAMADALADGIGSLRVELEASLRLRGHAVSDPCFPAVFDEASREIDLDRDVLSELERLRAGAPDVGVLQLVPKVLAMLERCVELADALEPGASS